MHSRPNPIMSSSASSSSSAAATTASARFFATHTQKKNISKIKNKIKQSSGEAPCSKTL
eukprot:EC852415.1.p3 GENE.EC852415.1~~EC852415.1.p3  ORF type:complete len:59 (+),score=10.59 EC852415.1:68-244(+)